MELTSLSVCQPHSKLVGVENIENPIAGDLSAHRDSRGVGIEIEVGHGVSIRGEDDLAT